MGVASGEASANATARFASRATSASIASSSASVASSSLTIHERARGLVHRAHVEAVHADARHAVARGARADVLDREAALDRQALRVLVHLADVDHRQLPERGEVRRLVEPALVRGAVAEERDGNLIGTELLRGERGAGRDGDAAAD